MGANKNFPCRYPVVQQPNLIVLANIFNSKFNKFAGYEGEKIARAIATQGMKFTFG